jgi:hypothetical protein
MAVHPKRVYRSVFENKKILNGNLVVIAKTLADI